MDNNTFQLTTSQTIKIRDIIASSLPTSQDEQAKAQVYGQFLEQYGINIYCFYWEDDRLSVRNQEGIELTSDELDIVLRRIKNGQHIARAPQSTSGNFKSITTVADGPKKMFAAYDKAKGLGIPEWQCKHFANLMMQEAESEISSLDDQQLLEYITRINFKQYFASQLALRRNVTSLRDTKVNAEQQFETKRQAKLTRADKKALKLKARQERVANASQKKNETAQLTAEQKAMHKEMRVYQLDPANAEDVAEFLRYKQRQEEIRQKRSVTK